MHHQLKSLIQTATFRQSVITLGSTVTSGGLGALFFFILARFLGSQQYGAFSTACVLIIMLSSVMDLGTSQGLVKFSRKYAGDPEKSEAVIKSTLLIKLVSGSVISMILLFFAVPLAGNIFHHPELAPYFSVSGLGIMGSLLFSFAYSLAQSRGLYILWGSIFVWPNFLRLLALLVLIRFGWLTGISALWLYIITPFVAFIGSLFFTDRKFISVSFQQGLIGEFFSFNKWITLTSVISTVGSRVEALLTAGFLTLSATGNYALAVQMVTLVPQLSSAFGAVTTPKFASFTNIRDNRRYLVKTTLLTILAAAGVILCLIPAAWILIRLIGSQYQQAFTPFLLLLGGMALFLASSPLRDSLTYYFGRPGFFALWSLIALLITVCLSLWLIPALGIIGSGAVVLIIQILGVLAAWIYYRWISRHQ